MRRESFLVLALLFLISLAPPNRAYPAPGYTIIDLGTVGGTYSSAGALSDNGYVVGTAATPNDASAHAFLYIPPMTDLGSPRGGTTNATAISKNGRYITGYSWSVGSGADQHAFWSDGTPAVDIGTLGGSYSYPFAVNDSGYVVGYSWLAGGGSNAFLYDPGTITMNNLHYLAGLPSPTYTYSSAWDINNSRQAVGNARVGGNYHAILYEPLYGTYTDLDPICTHSGDSNAYHINSNGQIIGTVSDSNTQLNTAVLFENVAGWTCTQVAPPAFSNSWPTAINDNGLVVGVDYTSGSNNPQAFIYESTNSAINLSPHFPQSHYVTAVSINNSNQVVGMYQTTYNGTHLFLYEHNIGTGTGAVTDLSNLFPDWILTGAVRINDAGQIAGTGIHNGTMRAFLMNPDPTLPLSITPATLPKLGTDPATIILTATGGAVPYTWSATGLPSFLTIDPATGVISKTFTSGMTGSYTFTVTVTGGTSTATQTYTLVIDDEPPTVTAPPGISLCDPNGTLYLNPNTLDPANQAFAFDTQDGQLPAYPDISSLPNPLTVPGVYTITWSAQDSAGNVGTATQQVIFYTPTQVTGLPLPGGVTVDMSFADITSAAKFSCGSVKAESLNAPPPAGINTPYGLLAYSVETPNQCEKVSLAFSTLPSGFGLSKVDLDRNFLPIPNTNTPNTDGWWVQTGNIIDLTLCDGGAFDLNPAQGIIEDPVAIVVALNRPPTAYGGVDKAISCIWSSCSVTLDGSGSTDPDGQSDITNYAWYEDYGKPGERLLAGGPDPSATVSLPLGSHEITLVVTDSVGNAASDTFTVTINPAALSLFEVRKAEVEWDKKNIKINGTIALPAGRSYYDVGRAGSIAIGLSSLGSVVNESVAFTAMDAWGRKWEYKGASGVTEFKIDWEGERFDYNQEIRIRSNHIGQDSTALEIDRKGVAGPLTIAVGAVNGATINIDAAGVVTTTPAGLKVDVDEDGEVEVELPFQLSADMTITVSGAVNAVISVADYYSAAIGKFEVESLFNPGAVMGDVRPASMKVDITLGDAGFPGSAAVNEPDWTKLGLKEWKMKR